MTLTNVNEECRIELRMLKKYFSLLVLTALFVGMFSMSASAIPVGCRGGVSGTPVPGTICPDGSIPVYDPTLPIGCPGGSQQGPVQDDYVVTCPARPGRNECVYSRATGNCIVAASDVGDVGEDGQKIYDRLLQAINVVSGIVGLIVVISIIIGGIQYTTAGGDPQKVAAAKGRVFNSIFAFLAYLFLYAFLQYLVPGGVF